MVWISWAIETVLLFALCGSAQVLYRKTRSIQELMVRLGHHDRVISILFQHVRRLVDAKNYLQRVVNNLEAELAEFLNEDDTEEEMPTIDSGYCEF